MNNIIVAGDFCPQNRVSRLFEENCFDKVLGMVRRTVSEANYAIVNFECPITKGGEEPIMKWGGNLCCTEKAMEAVKWAGFDCVTLANNHFYDFSEEGVRNTLHACSKYGIDSVGGGVNLQDASRVFYKIVNNKTLAIINCCEHEFSIATAKTGGSNPLNPLQQFYSIQDAKKNADFVLVITHGGHEHFQLPSPRMVETYRYFIDCGADAVVNHHQHCFSGYEVYKEKPIFYGLGNFCFDGNRSGKDIWYEGFMVKLDTDDSLSFEIIPFIQCKEEPAIVFLEKGVFDSRISQLNDIIVDPIRLEQEIEKYYNTYIHYYGDLLEPFDNRYYLALKHRGWLPSLVKKSRTLKALNSIECESHRDRFLYFLRQK